MYEPEEIESRKRAFAAALLQTPLDPVAAAQAVEPRSHFQQFIIAHWQYDADVQNYMRELRDSLGTEARIPSKDEFAAALWSEAQQIRANDLKLDYYKLLAKVLGYEEKPSSGPVIQNNFDNRRVILVPAPTPIDDWEKAATLQQEKLINAAN